MEIKEIAKDIYACMQVDNGFGWSNSGFVNHGGGLVVDTFWDLPRTRKMMELYGNIGKMPPRYLVNTHHNGDHTWGNQLFKDSEIIAHTLCAESMKKDVTPEILQAFITAPELPPEMKWFIDDIKTFDYSEVEVTLPTRLIDDRLDLDLDGISCHIIYVGPAHTPSDLIVYLPETGVVFGGDVLWCNCTPLGWEGSFEKWIGAINYVLSLEPEVIVPGHGPICGIKETKDLRDYFELVYTGSKDSYDKGLSPIEAAKCLDLGHYEKWTEPERLVFNVNRAYREFNGEPWDTPVDASNMFNEGYELRCHWEGK